MDLTSILIAILCAKISNCLSPVATFRGMFSLERGTAWEIFIIIVFIKLYLRYSLLTSIYIVKFINLLAINTTEKYPTCFASIYSLFRLSPKTTNGKEIRLLFYFWSFVVWPIFFHFFMPF
jgi:hypothetical protein